MRGSQGRARLLTAMPEQDPPSPLEPPGPASEGRNLPVPVPHGGLVAPSAAKAG